MQNMNLSGIPSEREGAGIFIHLSLVEGFSRGVSLPLLHGCRQTGLWWPEKALRLNDAGSAMRSWSSMHRNDNSKWIQVGYQLLLL